MASKRADIYLVDHGYYESRARAQAAIKAGCVRVNGKRLTKASFKLDESFDIEAKAEHPWVSRAGIKLAFAVSHFDIDISGKTCLDIGSSTGGFSQVLLANGAKKVYAVDVGQDQLHSRLHNHDRLVSLENTDARDLTADRLGCVPDLIVCDASFISLRKVLTQPLGLTGRNGALIALVKPQFEVGKAGIGRGGLVKSERLALQALSDICAWVEGQGWEVLSTSPSPIKGGSGNREYLVYARK